MKIKEIAREAALLVGRTDAAAYLGGGAAGDPASAKTDAERLVAAVNRAVRSLAVRGLPLRKEETVTSKGEVAFSSLAETVLRVEEVRDASGKKVKFKVKPGGLTVPAGKLTVRYRYLPAVRAEEEECDYPEGAPPREVLADGAAAEFSIVEGRYEDADMWQARFRAGLNAVCGISRARVPARRKWL